MRGVFISLIAATLLGGSPNDPQAILNEVSKLRQKYEECKASQESIQMSSKSNSECSRKNRELGQEIAQKNGVIRSLEQTLNARDRAFRDAAAQNKNLIAQLHTQNVSRQEREMLKRSLTQAKNELAEAQKALKQAGGTKVVYKDRPVTTEKIVEKVVYKDRPIPTEKIVTKTVESSEKIAALQRELSTAQATITNLRSTSPKPIVQEKIVEKVVYKDRPVATQKVVEKVVYKDRIVEKVVYKDKPSQATKVVEKVVYKDRPVIQEKIVEKVVYKDRPIPKEKIVEKVVYKDRVVEKPVEKIKVVEKVVYKDRPVVQEKVVEKVVIKEVPAPKQVTKTTLQAKAVTSPSQPKTSSKLSNDKQRQIDKLALERERLMSQSASAPKQQSSPVKRATPSAYRMATNAGVYNAINGTKIDMWESGRSFTSGTSSNGWVKITGYFVNRVWQPAGEELWVKESDVIKR